jgi:hypothetical protein
MDLISLCPLSVLLVLLVLFVWLLAVVIRALKRRALLRPVLFLVGIIILLGCLGCLAGGYGLYVGHCTGAVDSPWLRYAFQCSCPQSMENMRVQKLYSEHAEIMFSPCENVRLIPSPSGEKLAVLDYAQPDMYGRPDACYAWFLPTDEKMPFMCSSYNNLIWVSDDLLFVRGRYVVDLVARAEHPITERTDVHLANGEIDPSVLLVLREAKYVILTRWSVAAISPDALTSPEHTFIISYGPVSHESNAESFERVRQFLRDQDIDYLDYIVYERELDNLLPGKGFVSQDGRFFYSSDGIYLVETGEKIVDGISRPNPHFVAWVYDGVIVQCSSGSLLLVVDMFFYPIREPWLKLRVPAEYIASDASPDRD